MPYPMPFDETKRLTTLSHLDVLDPTLDPDFEDLCKLAALICGTSIALVSFMDAHRQVLKARVGLDVCSTSRDIAFCAHAIVQKELFIVPDARADERFKHNPLVTGEPFIRFYAGMPVMLADGVVLGTVCVIDHEARELSAMQREALRLLSKQIGVHLQNRVVRTRRRLGNGGSVTAPTPRIAV